MRGEEYRVWNRRMSRIAIPRELVEQLRKTYGNKANIVIENWIEKKLREQRVVGGE